MLKTFLLLLILKIFLPQIPWWVVFMPIWAPVLALTVLVLVERMLTGGTHESV